MKRPSVQLVREVLRARVHWLGVALVAAASPAWTQWSSDPLTNLSVGDGPSDQNLARLAVGPDGATWVSWFDGIGTGWDVRLQGLAADGTELLPHGGVLVADRSFSSTQGHDLARHCSGDALLIFRDDRSGSVEITVARYDASGTAVWGASGVALTQNAGFVATPHVAPAPDGDCFATWMDNGVVSVVRLDGAGAPVWAQPLTLVPPAGTYSVGDLVPSGDGVLVSLVHQTGGFSSPRHLLLQRVAGDGSLPWGPSPLAVFDGGSLQIGNYPEFVGDGQGGAVLGWYSASPALQCFAQRVDASGNELWAHDGVALATTAGQLRVAPHVAFDPATGRTYAAWTETDGLQAQRGIRAQCLDASGARQWSDDGAVLEALAATDATMASVVPDGGGASVYYELAPAFGTDRLYGVHLDAAGVVDVPRFDVASTPSGKMRLTVAAAPGFAVLAWTDDRVDGDVLMQAVRPDGSLQGTGVLGSVTCASLANSTGRGARLVALGSDVAADNAVTLVTTGLPENQFGYYLNSLTPGLIQPPGSQGNLCLSGGIGRYVNQIFASGTSCSGTLVLDLTQTPTNLGNVSILAGQTWYFQAWYRDLNPGNTSNFSEALAIPFL